MPIKRGLLSEFISLIFIIVGISALVALAPYIFSIVIIVTIASVVFMVLAAIWIAITPDEPVVEEPEEIVNPNPDIPNFIDMVCKK